MQITIRTIGNSRGLVLPKPLLVQVGLDDSQTAQISVENGAIVLRKPAPTKRAGWAKAAHAVAQAQGDALLLGEFGNIDDADLQW